MHTKTTLRLLVWVIAACAAIAAGTGVLSRSGPGPSEHVSVRGDTVQIWGSGLYRHMSADVAPQGIAQDVVTLLVGIPLLLIALRRAERGSIRARLVLAGALAYFLVTYLFYLMMGTYNGLFLAYTLLLGASFFALGIVLYGIDMSMLTRCFTPNAPVRGAGTFLIVNSVLIALLWLSIVVPPLIDGSVIPREVQHYTTLVVQGLDLALLLPLAIVAGWLLRARTPLGLLIGPVYLVFLALLMCALTAKVIAMGALGQNVVPAIFLIPTLNVLAIVFAVRVLRGVDVARYVVAAGNGPQRTAPTVDVAARIV